MKNLICLIFGLLFITSSTVFAQNSVKKCKPYTFGDNLSSMPLPCNLKICLTQKIECEINGVITSKIVENCSIISNDFVSLICFEEPEIPFTEPPTNCTNSLIKATFSFVNSQGISYQTITITDPNTLSRIYGSIIANMFLHPQTQVSIGPFFYDCDGQFNENPIRIFIQYGRYGPTISIFPWRD